MENRFKAIITGNDFYEEIDLPYGAGLIRFGTELNCHIRIRKERFFEPFILEFTEDTKGWAVECSNNTYLYIGDIRKLRYKALENGDVFELKYSNSDVTLIKVEFLLNFDYFIKTLNRQINIEGNRQIRIGKQEGALIRISSPYASLDALTLNREKDGFSVEVLQTEFGVCINGIKLAQKGYLKNRDFISVGDITFCYYEPYLWTESRNDISVNGLLFNDMYYSPEYPCFTQNTRIKQIVSKDPIEIMDPPTKPQKPKSNLFISLLPSMGMLVTSGLMASMGGGMILYSAISGAMAIVTSVATLISNNRDFKKESEKRIEKYNLYAERKRQEIEEERNRELKQIEEIYIDTIEEQELLDKFSSSLFDRHPEDEDFLNVRLGTGTVKALRQVEYKKQEKLEVEDDLQTIPEKISVEYKMIDKAPVACDFKNAGAISVVGAEPDRYSMMKKMIFDICTRHFPSDVELFFIATEEHADKVTWLRFLPHVNVEASGIRNIVADKDSRSRIFDVLYQKLAERKERNEENKDDNHLLVFLYDECGLQNHPLSKYIEDARKKSVTFVFFVENSGKAPFGCKNLIMMDSPVKGTLIDAEDKSNSTEFVFDEISDLQAFSLVQKLAPVYKEELSLEGSLTKNITLFQMFNILGAADLDLKERWNQSKVYKSMAAPIGVTKSGIIALDLHDKAHGPHGLVAGTTGSGKSELLQTYILSIATLFHPYEVSFVIIDFKGGGMVNQFRDLPHLLGAITNIDGKQINRSLKSIKAELQKRQRLFAEAEVNHIDKYIQKYKAGEAKEPIPHLVLIVDEFAELKAEQPDFMSELISAARIGRSLGVHLILATQKPSGQVDDQIWSNSRFKLCLKVQGPEDSNEVLKSPLAAEIKEPGRAYLQVGNNEIFELLQSAYSGAPERTGDSSMKEYTIYGVSTSGVRTPLFVQKRSTGGDSSATQLEAIVEYVNGFCQKERIAKLPDICLPPLSERIFFPEKLSDKKPLIDIGIYDDPDNQIQQSALIDFTTKHTFVLGSSQLGKTNLLQLVIRSLAETGSPAESVIYILDFGSMVLKNFESLKHVGGVVTSSEDEKLKNFFKLIFTEMAERKEKLLAAGVSSHAAYLEAGFTDIPHIYVMIDNMAALMELYLEDDDSLLTILRDGLAVGISVIATNQVTSGFSYRYMSNFANKIVFFCNDNGEYYNIFDHTSIEPDEVPGRCIYESDKRQLECQTYLAFNGEREIERVQEIRSFILSSRLFFSLHPAL